MKVRDTMSLAEDEIICASDSEKLIWDNIGKDSTCLSHTLSYRIDIATTLTIQEVQQAIFLLLNEYCAGFTYRFFEINSSLFKQKQKPNLHPVEHISSGIGGIKKIFSRTSSCLYYFAWEDSDPKRKTLFIHLSHLIFDGACYSDLCLALTYAFENISAKKTMIAHDSLKESNIESNRYWQAQLGSKLVSQPLPFLPLITKKSFISTRRTISGAQFQKLKVFVQQYHTTPFQLMMATLACLLHHYLPDCDEETINDLVITYCASQRRKHQPMGCYLKIFPLFIACHDKDSPLTIINKIQAQRHDHRIHQAIKLGALFSIVDEEVNRHQPLFNIVVNHSPGLLPLSSPTIKGEKVSVDSIDSQSGKRCLSVVYNFDDEKMVIQFESDRSDFAIELLNQLADNFVRTQAFILSDPKQHIGSLSLNTPAAPVSVGRVTQHSETSLADHLLMIIHKYADKTAIQSANLSITYKCLSQRLQHIRQKLQRIDPELLRSGVGIYLSRELHLPIAMLACIFDSIMFIPIATELPEQAIDELIRNSGISVIMADETTIANIKSTGKQLEIIQVPSNVTEGSFQIPSLPLLPGIALQNIAYTLYTSGSTGNPKGVLVNYSSLHNFLSSMSFKPGLNTTDTLLAMTPVSFDISICEILLPLFCGATVYLIDEMIRKDVKKLTTVIETSSITTIQATPSSYALLKNSSWVSNRPLKLMAGGEELPSSLAEYFLEQGHQFFNMYGPTEATIWASTSAVELKMPILIGEAVDNSALYVLDNFGNTPPLGVAGQLFITGKCVADGYKNLASENFVITKSGEKGYFTGDSVVAFGKNKIQYLKRIDDQIKIRGHRVELNEITERIKLIMPHLHVVTVLCNNPEPVIRCYYLCTDTYTIDSESLLSKLRLQLPHYKIPQAIIPLPIFPVTTSGKIDKKQLASMALNHTPTVKIEHEINNIMVAEIIAMIAEHFNISIVNSNTSLINYGFTSISFNKLSTLIEQKFSILISPHQFYRIGNVDDIAQHLQMNGKPDVTFTSAASHKRLVKRIAIIGYDALMPGGLDEHSFWEALIKHDDMVKPHQRSWLKSKDKAGYIDNIERFDRHFFNLSPLESARMDPRQRLLLQCAWKTLEHAGYAASSLRTSTLSCFVAASGNDYLLAQNRDQLPPHPYTLSGNALSMLANRLSHYFDWHGPSMVIDTACSGSFSALIRACDQLCLTDNGMSFVAAVNLITDHHLNESLDAGNFLSKLGRCASFSENADGYARGEGVIGFLLKPLEAAERDGDCIHAVIESIAENHGGYSHSLTAPNQKAQTSLLLQAYDSELASKLSYIETHGTGTRLGDPIEIDAIKSFEEIALDSSQQPIKLGSVKSNIGHLEAAAGLASLLKVILAMKHRQLPANLHFKQINSLINLDHSRMEILSQHEPWDTNDELVAGVSSFGFGGANAHIVVSNAYRTQQTETNNDLTPCLIVLSAKSECSLKQRVSMLKRDLHLLPTSIRLQDIAYTLAVGRDQFTEYRLAYIASTRNELILKLDISDLNSSNTIIPHHLLPYHSAYLLKDTVNWTELYGGKSHQRVALSSYVFDEKNYWYTSLLKDKTFKPSLLSLIHFHPDSDRCEITIEPDHPFLDEHRVHKNKVLPGVAYFELAMIVLKNIGINKAILAIDSFYWLRPALVENGIMKLYVYVSEIKNGFQITFKNHEGKILSYGSFAIDSNLSLPKEWLNEVKQDLLGDSKQRYSTTRIYEGFSNLGIEYGSLFRAIDFVEVCGNVSEAKLTLGPERSMVSLLDCALQSGMAISLDSGIRGLMPFTLGALIIHDKFKIENINEVKVFTRKLSPFRTNIIVCDNEDKPLLSFIDLGVKGSALEKKSA